MKKNLLVWLVLISWCILSGCKFSQIVDWDWMEREIQYPIAEQECIDNDGEITTNSEWTPICLFSEDEYCYLEDMEDWGCDLIPQWGEWITVVTDMCNEQWWFIEWRDWEEFCYFEDKTFCSLEDLAAWNCKKWDMSLINDWLEDELADCDAEWENIVCWKDGNTYYNRCYLDFAWVEEEIELAEVVDWECVFG